MPPTCPACGASVVAGARFCSQCGAPVPGGDGASVRKIVTTLFCDLVGSTALGERTDPESLRALLERYFAEMRSALERHGGTVEKFIGDAVVAFFGVTVTREDDAVRAVRAAVDMLGALEALNPELRARWGVELEARIGVNTGEVLVRGDAERTVGDAVNVAARLEQAAGPHEILVGETTWLLVRDLAEGEPVVPLEVKGKDQAVAAWRVHSVAAVTEAVRGEAALRAELVGRRRELAALEQALERAVADRSCQLVTVFGVPGVGKSRLTREFLASMAPTPDAGPARVLASRCLSYGDGTALRPVLEMLRAGAGLTGGESDEEGRRLLAAAYGEGPDAEQVVELLAPLAGLGGTPAAVEEVHWALRRWLEALGRQVPVVWVVDDLHWAEPALLAAVEDVADWTRDAPVMVLCLARPEFLDEHPGWGGGKLNVTNLLLKPLSAEESTQLVEELLGGAGLPAEAMAKVIEGAGGTPLFLEHLLAMLVDDGLLVRAGSGWRVTAPLDAVTVPPTVGALLAARLERLSAPERQVLDAASVVGQLFYAGAVAELAALGPAEVAGHLRSLARKEMVRAAPSDIAGEDGYAFTHILVRDAAYHAITKQRRAELHGRLARWLDKRSAGLSAAVDEFVGHHLAEAVTLRRSVGDIDEGLDDLAAEAAGRLAAVAWRVMANDLTSAVSLYERAAALSPDGGDRLDHRLHHGLALFRAQRFAEARGVLDGVLADAEQAGDRALEFRARVVWLGVAAHTPGELALEPTTAALQEAVAFFEASGDDEGLALATFGLIQQYNLRARWEPMIELADAVVLHATRTGDQHLVEHARLMRFAALAWGPRPVSEALDAVRRARTEVSSRAGQATLRHVECVLLACADRPGEAWAAMAESSVIVEESHSPFLQLYEVASGAEAARILGDDVRTEERLTWLMDELTRTGESSFLSTIAPALGMVRVRQGRIDEARRLADLGRELALDHDVASQALWRLVAALVAAAEGDEERATAQADEAVTWMRRGDQTTWTGEMVLGRAEVAAAFGHVEEARAHLGEAIALFAAKGDVASGRRARQRLAALPGGDA